MMDHLHHHQAQELLLLQQDQGGHQIYKEGPLHLQKQKKKLHHRCHEWCRFILDFLLFYTTAFFVLLAIFSLFALVFLVPFFIDPAWSTLKADFDPQGTQCNTISGQYLEGRSVCDWSSCQEGCTKTVYTCWKILVEYELPGVNPGDPSLIPTSTGRLYPNVKGCGYPPNVDCNEFLKTYGKNGTNFTCFVARTDPELVIVNLDLHEVKSHLFYSLAVPFPCLFISLCYLVFAYKFIYNEKPNKDAFRPVASAAAAGSALAAFIDLRDTSEDQDQEKERQRKFLLQIQRTKWLAQRGKLAKGTSVPGTTSSTGSAPTTPGSCPGSITPTSSSAGTCPRVDRAKSVRMQDLQQDSIGTGSHEAYLERMKKDRSSYTTEKHKVLNYYNYFNING